MCKKSFVFYLLSYYAHIFIDFFEHFDKIVQTYILFSKFLLVAEHFAPL